MGLVALHHVRSSWTRDRTCVPCNGRQIPNHWTIREVPRQIILNHKSLNDQSKFWNCVYYELLLRNCIYMCILCLSRHRNKPEKINTKLCCSLGCRISRELLHYTSLIVYFEICEHFSATMILYFFCFYCCWIKSLKVGTMCYTCLPVCLFNQKNNKSSFWRKQ